MKARRSYLRFLAVVLLVAEAVALTPIWAQSSSSEAQLPPAGPPGQSSVQARVRARRKARAAQQVADIYGHKYEAYIGGSYLRFRNGDTLQKATESGWDAGITRYYTPKLGVALDFRGLYGTAYTYNNSYQMSYQPAIYQYAYMGGPQYRFYRRPKIAVSARVLAGGIYGNFDGDITSAAVAKGLGLYPTGTALAVNASLPVDLNLSPALAVRLAPDYLFTNFGSSTQNNRGFTASVLYRFGKKK